MDGSFGPVGLRRSGGTGADARLEQGRWHKAERGELGFNLPRGYLKHPSGEVVLDPDERVRDTIRLVFDIFERRGSVHGVMRYLID
ncbi:hypothetical protein, partial [Klebsiella pneumoniae]|uniref:hypothetical protein n=1 Tax=Klebsiella pneumoniae TaxID=573 RepID=UPI003A886FC9